MDFIDPSDFFVLNMTKPNLIWQFRWETKKCNKTTEKMYMNKNDSYRDQNKTDTSGKN